MAGGSGPILFAYDGSDLARLAIEEAGELLKGHDALVACVWQPFDVGFIPPSGLQFDAAQVQAVRRAAEQTAEHGASLADTAGFQAQSIAVEATPAWRGIVDLAEERDAKLIVLGSHGRSGLSEIFVGSVAAAVSAHSRRTILITHRNG
jgi:nucleotide-binding universal stress UspA family protein